MNVTTLIHIDIVESFEELHAILLEYPFDITFQLYILEVMPSLFVPIDIRRSDTGEGLA